MLPRAISPSQDPRASSVMDSLITVEGSIVFKFIRIYEIIKPVCAF